ncbi:MAG: PIN domain-containing protein [Terriglobales bacterium]
MPRRKVYFDTSIFLEMGTKKSKHAKNINSLLSDLNADKARVYTSILTVQEFSVAAYRKGAPGRDTYGDIHPLARIYGLTKDIALTAAKHEAGLRDITAESEAQRDPRKPETEEQKLERICENRRRKWDCFHLATAQLIGCVEMYSTDENLRKRPGQLGIKNLRVIGPEPPKRRIAGPLTDNAGLIDV